MNNQWMIEALCQKAKPDTFFPEGRDRAYKSKSIALAKQICAHCPVRRECLDFALDQHLDYGVWGGVDEKERYQLRLSLKRQ